MTTYTDRCSAVTAALQDLARDLEADLGKLARWRGTRDGSISPTAHLRDPGDSLDELARQRAEQRTQRGDMTVRDTLSSYSAAADTAKAMVHINAPAGDDLDARTTVYDLVAAIQNVQSHDDAVALVATFTEE